MKKLDAKRLFRIIFLCLVLFVICAGYPLYNHSRFLIHYFYGNKMQKEGNIDKAIEEYKKALKVYDDNAYLYNNMGISYYKKGDFEKALECYKKSIKISPNFAIVHNNIGVLYDGIGNIKDAIKEYKKAIEIRPNYAEAYKNLGLTFYRDRSYMQAAEAFEKYLLYAPYGISEGKWLRIIKNLRDKSRR